MTLPTVKFSRRLGAQSLAVAIVSGLMMSSFGIRTAEAHEPIFAPGAHVHSKDGHELALEYQRDRTSGAGEKVTEQELALEYEYGVTADWTVKAEIPLVDKDSNGNGSTGIGDMVLGLSLIHISEPTRPY